MTKDIKDIIVSTHVVVNVIIAPHVTNKLVIVIKDVTLDIETVIAAEVIYR